MADHCCYTRERHLRHGQLSYQIDHAFIRSSRLLLDAGCRACQDTCRYHDAHEAVSVSTERMNAARERSAG